MNIEDIKTINKISNKHLNIESNIESIMVSEEGNLNEKGGIVKMMRDSFKTDEEYKTMQEQHNAGHVLFFFSMIADAAISGRSTGNDLTKLERINAHMMTLREFVGANQSELNASIVILLERLKGIAPADKNGCARFVFENWLFIYTIAKAYGHHHKCFSDAKYRKLGDVICGRFYLRRWWWEIRIKALQRIGRKIFRGKKKSA